MKVKVTLEIDLSYSGSGSWSLSAEDAVRKAMTKGVVSLETECMAPLVGYHMEVESVNDKERTDS